MLLSSEWPSGSKCPLSELCFKILLAKSAVWVEIFMLCVFDVKKKLPILAGLPLKGRLAFQTWQKIG